MSRLWRAATTPTQEDVTRHILIRNSLTQGISNAVKQLQLENVTNEEPITSDDTVNSVCYYLEAIFIHGIKNSLTEKFNSFFNGNSDKVPHPHFWNIAMSFSHNDVTCQVNHLTQISTDIGRCRAWLRIALNDGLLESYVKTMIKDVRALKNLYKPEAYLRDPEHPDILISIIEGLAQFSFNLSFNSRVLNSWTSKPLILCGVWSPAMSLDPVMPGVDVATYFECEEENDMTEDLKTKLVDDLVHQEERETGRPRALAFVSSEQAGAIATSEESSPNSADQIEIIKSDADEFNATESLVQDSTDAQNKTESWININPNVFEAQSDPFLDLCGTSPSIGESLAVKSGWSSPFDYDGVHTTDSNTGTTDSAVDENESFDSLLNSYNQSRKQAVIIGTPSSCDLMFLNSRRPSSPYISKDEQDSHQILPKASSPISLEGLEFEVVPKNFSFLSKNVDSRTQILLNLTCTIANERGLDFQNYKCQGCKRPVGMIYGKARVCQYDACYYCFECHENETSVIPSRIVHNWDFQKYPVCNFTKAFITEVEDEPLFDVRRINPQLYSLIDELNAIQILRTELSYLRSYLFTCRESIAEEFRKKIWPKEYLYEHIHLYALSDLMNIANGALAQTLQKIRSFASKHVQQCRLCNQKGFICEICNNPKVIYPFELGTTFRCEVCLAVYHSGCMKDGKLCPKCQRRQQRKIESEDFALSE